jgi:hypothetical protein
MPDLEATKKLFVSARATVALQTSMAHNQFAARDDSTPSGCRYCALGALLNAFIPYGLTARGEPLLPEPALQLLNSGAFYRDIVVWLEAGYSMLPERIETPASIRGEGSTWGFITRNNDYRGYEHTAAAFDCAIDLLDAQLANDAAGLSESV